MAKPLEFITHNFFRKQQQKHLHSNKIEVNKSNMKNSPYLIANRIAYHEQRDITG